jgi:hypothetical protein
MSWIKRNLFFFVGSVVALVLMGLAGFFLFTKWQANNQIQTELASDYENLKALKAQNPHPGDEKVNNIEIARAQQKQISNFVYTARTHFVSVPRVPAEEDAPTVTDQSFSVALSRTLDQLSKEATNASVMLPPNYKFSFEAQKNLVSFKPASLLPLSIQLGEVKAICDILFAAKINALDNIRRERATAEDLGSGGLQTDYHTEKTITNELAALTPYELTFKCFSTELGQVLAGFASSPHAYIVKTINVEGAPVTQATEEQLINPGMATPVYIPQPVAQPQSDAAADSAARFARRYGLGGGGGRSRYGGGAAGPGGPGGGVPLRTGPAPTPYVAPQGYAPQPTAVSASKSSGLPTVLDERQLKVTMNLALVKLLPPK